MDSTTGSALDRPEARENRDQAIRKGQGTYIGQVCKRDHHPAIRSTANRDCMACRAIARKRRYRTIGERIKADQRKYNKTKREEISKKKRMYYLKNRETILAKTLARYHAKKAQQDQTDG